MIKSTKIIFRLLILSFIIVVIEMFVPIVQDFMQGKIFLIPIFIFALVSGWLVFNVWKSDIKGKFKIFLLFSGISGIGFILCFVLHNVFYALSTISENIIFLKYLFEILSVTFFIVGTIICPITFLIGALGTLWYLVKNKKNHKIK